MRTEKCFLASRKKIPKSESYFLNGKSSRRTTKWLQKCDFERFFSNRNCSDHHIIYANLPLFPHFKSKSLKCIWRNPSLISLQSFIKSKTPTFFAIHDDKCMNFHGKVASKNAKPVKMSLVCAKVISRCKVPIWNGSFTAYYTRFFAPYLQIFWNSHH